MELQDRVIIVSGGASGLGAATCRLFAQRGVRGVGIVDLDEPRGSALAAELGERGSFVRTDISDAQAVDAAVAAIAERLGAVHFLVNCAAIGGPAKLIGRDGPIALEKFDRVMRINLYGTLHLMRAAVPLMLRNTPNEDGERGVVINVSSGAAYEGQVGQVAYAASKAALVGMTMPLARELGGQGVRVVTVAPGAFDTPIYEQAPPAVKETIVRGAVFPKRMGHADEFARFAAEIATNAMHNARTYRLDAGLMLPAS
ncbi:MAG: SDR family NAD(P)-dependent oxidoreductase [Burkholderiaceae bacterium]|nr:SDR family NAD(P)-dependent oxidoreductase [Burkholderiaceae bacterium]